MSNLDLNSWGWMGLYDEPVEQLWLGKLSALRPWISTVVHWIIRSISSITQTIKSKSHLRSVVDSISTITAGFRRRSTLIGDYHVR